MLKNYKNNWRKINKIKILRWFCETNKTFKKLKSQIKLIMFLQDLNIF